MIEVSDWTDSKFTPAEHSSWIRAAFKVSGPSAVGIDIDLTRVPRVTTTSAPEPALHGSGGDQA